MKNQDYCQIKAAPSGSNFYYSTLFYPESTRQSLNTIHAFSVEIGEIIRECSDPGIARIKLNWWHEEIQRVFKDQARHPVGKALTNLKNSHSINEDELHSLVIFNEKKIDNVRFDTYEQLESYLKNGPGLVWQLSAEICNYTVNESATTANTTGCLVGLFDIIQNIYRDFSNGYFFLPQTELEAANLTLADFSIDKQEHLQDFFASQFKNLIINLENNYSEFPVADRKSLLCCLIMNKLIHNTCKEIEKDNYQLGQHFISLTPVRKLWIAWRTNRG